MSKSIISKLVARVSKFAAAVTVAVIIPSCGGGGGADEFGPPTVRPKTMNEVVLALDSFASFLFIPNSDEPGAAFTGDIEVGAFSFNRIITDIDMRPYANTINGQTNTTYPLSITEGTYTYQGLNDNQGILTLTGIGLEPNPIVFEEQVPTNSQNGGLMGLFTYTSDSIETNIVEIILTFDSNAGFVDLTQVRVVQPESVNPLDNVFITVSELALLSGEQIPLNYLGLDDVDGYGNISAETLDLQFLRMTSGTSTVFDFTLDFVAEFTDLDPGLDGLLPEETGTCVVSVDNGMGGTLAITNAAQYTWRRILGTNSGELVLTGIPDAGVPLDTQLNTSFILDFEALDAGPYTGPDADLSGTFLLIDTLDP